MAISDYSTTPDENVTISGINIAEGCAPSGINNAIRQMMADIKTDATSKAASISSVTSELETEVTRAKAAEEAEVARAQAAEAAEVARAKAAEAGYLPLTGGTMQGPIIRNDLLAKNASTVGGLALESATSTENGACLFLYGGDRSIDYGAFILRASYSNGVYKDLKGTPDGTLTWNGLKIPTTLTANKVDFYWNGSNLIARVDNSVDVTLATTTWVNHASYADYLPNGCWVSAVSGVTTVPAYGTWNVLCVASGPYFTAYGSIAGGSQVGFAGRTNWLFGVRIA